MASEQACGQMQVQVEKLVRTVLRLRSFEHNTPDLEGKGIFQESGVRRDVHGCEVRMKLRAQQLPADIAARSCVEGLGGLHQLDAFPVVFDGCVVARFRVRAVAGPLQILRPDAKLPHCDVIKPQILRHARSRSQYYI